MHDSQNSDFSNRIIKYSFVLTAFFSLAALTATFLISNSGLDFELKTLIFIAVAIGYLLISALFYFWQKTKIPGPAAEIQGSTINDEIEGKLFALEEANEFFGASLKSADMFRLVASRFNEIVPLGACVLYIGDEADKSLKIKYADGENAREFTEFTGDIYRSLAVKAYLSRKKHLDDKIIADHRVFPPEMLKKFGSAMAIPLFRRGEIFGVLVLYSFSTVIYDEKSLNLAEAVGERVAPLFIGSFAFEQSISNALTDSLTNLPNERAFFLVLENQIAESQRYRDDRPLTILAIDIRNFEEINKNHGHLVGDRLLEFAAEIIKTQLRQMDTLTRSTGDEFLAVLPTANEVVAEDVKNRINRAFVSNPFKKSATEKFHLELNFGTATFWRDGETARDLLQTALVRKNQDKSADRGKVLWFPKEFVN